MKWSNRPAPHYSRKSDGEVEKEELDNHEKPLLGNRNTLVVSL